MSEETIKLGFVETGICININLIYFVPNQDFDLYSRASLFKWHRPEGNWGEFAIQLTADGFASVYSHVDVEGVEKAVAHYEGREGHYELIDGPMPMAECEHILRADEFADSRLFQLDRYSPTRMGINRLLEVWPNVTQYLTAQYLAYLAYMVQDHKTAPEFIELITAWSEDPTQDKAVQIGKVAEERYAMKRTRRLVDDGGYSISGFSGELTDEANVLYTVGLTQNGPGYEIFCRGKIRIELMSTLMNQAVRIAFETPDVATANQQIAALAEFKKLRPRLVLCRNEKIDQVFTYRLSDKFEVYRLMFDNN